MATLSCRCSGGDVWLRQPRLRVSASPSSGLDRCCKEEFDTIAQVRRCSLGASLLEAIPRCPMSGDNPLNGGSVCEGVCMQLVGGTVGCQAWGLMGGHQ